MDDNISLNKQVFVCPFCEKYSSTKIDLTNHVLYVHMSAGLGKDPIEVFKCLFCSQVT